MPKINFNVPFLSETGEPIKRIKVDTSNMKLDKTTNQPRAIPFTDEEGNVMHEEVKVRDLLVQLLHMPQDDDKQISFEDRAKRGKLARKIANNNSASYNDNEIATIEEYSRRNGSTVLLGQLDDLLRGIAREDAYFDDKEIAA